MLSDISVDLSTMSTSMPSSSGAEETGEAGTGRMLEAEGRQVEAVSLMLRSMGESPPCVPPLVVGVSWPALARADLAAPNLARS